MCLIIYAKNAQLIDKEIFWDAAQDNNDGIGVMAQDGASKYLGRKMVKRAYARVKALAAAGMPYAVHFRWATHGSVSKQNTHPFNIPGTDYWLMHNGVLWTQARATEDASDTAIFAREVMPYYIEAKDAPSHSEAFWRLSLGDEAGGSKLLLMRQSDGEFTLINEHYGHWVAGMWYSNLYSFRSYGVPLSSVQQFYGTSLRQALVKRAAPSGPTLTGAGDDDDAERLESWYASRTRRGGFNWHDRDTWDRYPIPGSWDDRFPVCSDPLSDDDDERMSGVQPYV